MKMIGSTPNQAKLLFFGLLRTVSALASTESKVAVPFGSARAGTTQQHSLPEITLRLARRTDVPSIQRCNLASLPENYNAAFYASSLRQWPELALVAECTSEPSPLDAQQSLYSPFPTTKPANIVAYVIGKVEEHSEMVPVEQSYGDWGYASSNHIPPPVFRTTKLGHVTSLAVLDGYRRMGLAQALMEQLHHHMTVCYPGVQSVGLHVRRHSNVPAVKLYERFGYDVSEMIPAYYQDGEDAYFMRKRLKPLVPQNKVASLLNSLRRSKPWENGDEQYRLPRLVGRPSSTAAVAEEERQPTPELLTGTL